MRLIDADALKKAFKAWKTMDDYYHDTDCNDIPFSEAFDLIDNSPTVARTERPVVILYDQAIYITQGHIDAMIEYERKQQVKEIIENLMKGLNDERS